MGQDYLEELRTKIREQVQKEAAQEAREAVAKIYFETLIMMMKRLRKKLNWISEKSVNIERTMKNGYMPKI